MKKRYIVLILGLALSVYIFMNILIPGGVFVDITPGFDGGVKQIYTNVPGPEDIDIDRARGILFISSTDRRTNGNSTTDGIYILYIDSLDYPSLLENDFKGGFHPHGISFVDLDTAQYLYVVNHNKLGDFVEVFRFKDRRLFHLASYQDPNLMCCPNDVVALSERTFYVTNDHGNKTGFQRTMEEYLRLAQSNIMYFNGSEFTEAFLGLKMANGIEISNDGSQVYATHTLGQEVLTFNRNTDDGRLTIINKTDLSSGVDNIDVDSEGTLWVGSHPKLFGFVAHAEDPEKYAPSQVFKLIPKDGEAGFLVKEVFLDNGQMISGSSVAVHYKSELFIGCVFDKKVLHLAINQ